MQKTMQMTSPNGNSIDFIQNDLPNGVLVIGVFHGDEPQGEYLINKYLEICTDSKLSFIPCLNPDGMELNQRVNANGVDLNRNFPTKNWEFTKKNEFWGGAEPSSEFETRFLIDIIERIKPRLILTLHAPFKIVNYDGNAEDIAEKISKIINYPTEKSIGYPTPGSFGTWAGVEKGIPTVTLELDEEIEVAELEEPVFRIFKLLENY